MQIHNTIKNIELKESLFSMDFNTCSGAINIANDIENFGCNLAFENIFNTGNIINVYY